MEEIEELQLHPRIKTEAAKGAPMVSVMDENLSIKMIDGSFALPCTSKRNPNG